MEIIKQSEETLSILQQGIQDLSSMNEEVQVLNYIMTLCLSHCNFQSGYIMRKIVGDTWLLNEQESIHLPMDIVTRIAAEDFSAAKKLQGYFAEEFNIAVNKIASFKVENVLVAALLLFEDENRQESGEPHRACLSLISQYASSKIGHIKLKEEIRRINTYYNELIVKKEMAEKLASLGTIAAGLAHEIKNPLVSIKTLIQLLPEKFDDPEFRDHFTNIAINEVERISNIVSDLLEFARSSEPQFTSLSIGSFIDYIISMLSYQFAKKKITIKKRVSEHLPLISADGSQLKQVLLNIIINSMDAMPDGGEIVIEAMRGEDIIDGEKVVLKITDTGSGIPDGDREHLFEPFFTTKDSGTGLGLSICKSIMEKHQGKIHIESVNNKGTAVTMVFPAKSPSSPQTPLIALDENNKETI